MVINIQDMDQVISNLQPVIDFIEDSLSTSSLPSCVTYLLLVCPCYQPHLLPRCEHCTPSTEFPFLPVPRCLSVGEFSWIEMAQPFLDNFKIRVLWRCEDLTCGHEYSCGVSSL